ncbi:prostate and testis expressed protein 13-like isoform X1 [Equus caballus]|uniref:Prostate and testis expressed 2 n=1 Tax=Equus caballus TaxID=9796 RepID=A0A3Q2HFM4_HORSE
MGSRMFRLLLLGIFTALFMDEGNRVLTSKWIRYCHKCDLYDGYKCLSSMGRCWKFNVLNYERVCTTDHFYFNDRLTGRYFYRYSTLSCRACEEGMVRLFHDLVRETYCCNSGDRCNDGDSSMDLIHPYRSRPKEDNPEST